MKRAENHGQPAARHIMQSALQRTCDRLDKLPEELLPLLNESVLRFFFVQSLLKGHQNCKLQQEWHRFDLLVQHKRQNILVEFKFYCRPVGTSLTGDHRWPKGGPGKKNFKEFINCVKKLASIDKCKWRTIDKGKIDGRYLVLAYLNDSGYKRYYAPLDYPPRLRAFVEENGERIFGNMACRLIEIRSPQHRGATD
ncbi:MAG TPA: hypothetical protein VMT20_13530 [Terriglobia bacterium]|nr:hypothetical protein [Terriglobia bacterium]